MTQARQASLALLLPQIDLDEPVCYASSGISAACGAPGPQAAARCFARTSGSKASFE